MILTTRTPRRRYSSHRKKSRRRLSDTRRGKRCLSFAFGQDITHTAVRLGNPEVRVAYAVWPIGSADGLLPNVGNSILLLCRNRTRAYFQFIYPDLFWATLMAILWMGAFARYGM